MSKKDKARIARDVANLDASEQLEIVHAKDDDLPRVLQELGISLPSTNWWFVVLKIILYVLGLVLAGVGTTAAAQTLILYGNY